MASVDLVPVLTDVGWRGNKTDKQRKTFNVDDAVEFFKNANSSHKIRGNLPLSLTLANLETKAKQLGLNEETLAQFMEVVVTGKFPESVTSKIIKCLIPSGKVPVECAVKAISWMCTNKPSSNIQSLLLRWLTLVFDYLDDRQQLHSLYGIIFYFIENETLCPHVCHLLYLLTRKEDVKLFRVRQLLNLQLKMGVQSHITGLLAIYKLYYPNLVTIVISKRQRVYFKQTDKVWAANIRKVQDLQNDSSNPNPFPCQLAVTAVRSSNKRKRRKVELIPSIETSTSNKSTPSEVISTSLDTARAIPFKQIQDMSDLCCHIDQIEFPSQIGSTLSSPLLQYTYSCWQDPVLAERLSYWLNSVLLEEFMTTGCCSEHGEQLLQMLIHFTDFIQEGVPVVDTFLTKYLYIWNGVDYRPYILKLITRFRIYSFTAMNDLLLEPLRKLYFCSTVYFKCQLLVCFTQLLYNFVTIECERYKKAEQIQQAEQITTTESHNFDSLFSENVEAYEPLQTVSEFIQFVGQLCVVGLQQERNNTLLLHCILDFYDLVSTLPQKFSSPFVVTPPPTIVYKALLSNNAVNCSRICTIMCNYREAFEYVKSNESDTWGSQNRGLEHIQTFNSQILDICDSLWRYKAFMSNNNQMSIFKFSVEHLQQLAVSHVNETFSIHQHQAFLGFAWKFMKKTQPPGKKLHTSLIKPVRQSYLEFFRMENLHGICDFIATYIKAKTKSASK